MAKFLSFNGRMHLRKNGLIEITSPDDELAGFHLRLRQGTDSYSIAYDALEDQGLTRKNSGEVYANVFNSAPEDELLLGVNDAGEPVTTALPKPGGIVWIVGSAVVGGTVKEAFRTRVGGLTSKALHAYGAQVSFTQQMEWYGEAEDLKTAMLACRKTTRMDLPVVEATLDQSLMINGSRDEFRQAKILPIVCCYHDVGIEKDDLSIVTGPYSKMQSEDVPTEDQWHREVPLGCAFVKLPGEQTYTRFRPC